MAVADNTHLNEARSTSILSRDTSMEGSGSTSTKAVEIQSGVINKEESKENGLTGDESQENGFTSAHVTNKG